MPFRSSGPIRIVGSHCRSEPIGSACRSPGRTGESTMMSAAPSLKSPNSPEMLSASGLPEPILEPWVAEGRVEDCVIIDFGHTLGTTRMSDNPRSGVWSMRNSQVHGVSGLYIAGASVFPTSGHANPTLMILALAIRLADKIKSEISWTASIE